MDCAPLLQVKRERSIGADSPLAADSPIQETQGDRQSLERDVTCSPRMSDAGPSVTVSAEHHQTVAKLHSHLALACNTHNKSNRSQSPAQLSSQSSSPQPNETRGASCRGRPAAPRRKPSRLLIPQPATNGGRATSPRSPTGPEIEAASSLLFYLPQFDF